MMATVGLYEDKRCVRCGGVISEGSQEKIVRKTCRFCIPPRISEHQMDVVGFQNQMYGCRLNIGFNMVGR